MLCGEDFTVIIELGKPNGVLARPRHAHASRRARAPCNMARHARGGHRSHSHGLPWRRRRTRGDAALARPATRASFFACSTHCVHLLVSGVVVGWTAFGCEPSSEETALGRGPALAEIVAHRRSYCRSLSFILPFSVIQQSRLQPMQHVKHSVKQCPAICHSFSFRIVIYA